MGEVAAVDPRVVGRVVLDVDLPTGRSEIEAAVSVAGGETFSEKKPSAVPVLETLERLGATSDRAVIVGDGYNDIRAGRAAGVRTFAVAWGYDSVDRLAAERPDQLIESVTELHRCLGAR